MKVSLLQNLKKKEVFLQGKRSGALKKEVWFSETLEMQVCCSETLKMKMSLLRNLENESEFAPEP